MQKINTQMKIPIFYKTLEVIAQIWLFGTFDRKRQQVRLCYVNCLKHIAFFFTYALSGKERE